LAKAALNLAAFMPLGFLAALARPNDQFYAARPARPWFALAVPALVEVLQIFVYSRSSSAGDVVTGMVGVYFGWRIGLALLRRSAGAQSAQSFLTAYPVLFTGFVIWLLTVVYVFWNPFDFTTDPTRFASDPEDFAVVGFRRLHLAPFADYYWGSKYNALDQFARKALSFLPLGVVVALSLRNLFSRAAGVWTVLLAFAVAVPLEIGRYFLPTRTPSTTDVIIACAGAWLGFWIAQRFRVVTWAESALYGWIDLPQGSNSRLRPTVSRW
jgi:glycopeptide antibiotics resistance protein